MLVTILQESDHVISAKAAVKCVYMKVTTILNPYSANSARVTENVPVSNDTTDIVVRILLLLES
jgi:hypothetical protein